MGIFLLQHVNLIEWRINLVAFTHTKWFGCETIAHIVCWTWFLLYFNVLFCTLKITKSNRIKWNFIGYCHLAWLVSNIWIWQKSRRCLPLTKRITDFIHQIRYFCLKVFSKLPNTISRHNIFEITFHSFCWSRNSIWIVAFSKYKCSMIFFCLSW